MFLVLHLISVRVGPRSTAPDSFGGAAKATAHALTRAGLSSLRLGSARGVDRVLAADQLDLGDLGGIASTESDAYKPSIASGASGESRGNRLKELPGHVTVCQITCDEPPRVKDPSAPGPIDETAFCNSDQAFDEWTEFLGLRHGGLDPLMPQECLRLVPKQRDAVLGGTPQFPMCNSMTHEFLFRLSRRRAGGLLEPHSKT